MNSLRRLYCWLVVKITRPYIFREYYGWGKIYKIFVGHYEKDWLWKAAQPIWMKGKYHGYKMYLDITTWSDRSTYFLGRWYDLECQMLLEIYLEKGDNVIDVGGNKGMFSLHCSHIVGNSGNVDAFEPNPEPRTFFEKHLQENNIKNVNLHNFGLSDKNEKMTLNVPYVNSGEGTFGKSKYKADSYYQTECLVKIGDDVLQDSYPDLIKIDVEGFEQYVLQGLTKTISRAKPVVLTELIKSHLSNANSSVAGITDFFKALGYKGYKIGLKKRSSTYYLEVLPVDDFHELPDCDIIWINEQEQRHSSLINKIR